MEDVASTVSAPGSLSAGGVVSATVTLKLPLAWFPCASVARAGDARHADREGRARLRVATRGHDTVDPVAWQTA